MGSKPPVHFDRSTGKLSFHQSSQTYVVWKSLKRIRPTVLGLCPLRFKDGSDLTMHVWPHPCTSVNFNRRRRKVLKRVRYSYHIGFGCDRLIATGCESGISSPERSSNNLQDHFDCRRADDQKAKQRSPVTAGQTKIAFRGTPLLPEADAERKRGKAKPWIPLNFGSARGFGKTGVVASSDNAGGRQRNRRVEIIVAAM